MPRRSRLDWSWDCLDVGDDCDVDMLGSLTWPLCGWRETWERKVGGRGKEVFEAHRGTSKWRCPSHHWSSEEPSDSRCSHENLSHVHHVNTGGHSLSHRNTVSYPGWLCRLVPSWGDPRHQILQKFYFMVLKTPPPQLPSKYTVWFGTISPSPVKGSWKKGVSRIHWFDVSPLNREVWSFLPHWAASEAKILLWIQFQSPVCLSLWCPICHFSAYTSSVTARPV